MGGGIAVSSLGHAHPAITEALVEQSRKVIHTSNFYYHEPQGRLAQALVSLIGPGKCFFCNSGVEANEGLFKLARKFPGYYKTTDGEWAIERGDAECEGWVGQWMVQHQVNNNLFSGPFKTLNEAIEELGAMIVSRRKGEI